MTADREAAVPNESAGRHVESNEIHYKDQMSNRSENDRIIKQCLVHPSVVMTPTDDIRHDHQSSKRDVVRPRLNISELVVHYGSRRSRGGGENNNHPMEPSVRKRETIRPPIDKEALFPPSMAMNY